MNWHRLACYTGEHHSPVIGPDPNTGRCPHCGHTVHKDAHGQWWCESTQQSSMVLRLFVLVVLVLTWSGLITTCYALKN